MGACLMPLPPDVSQPAVPKCLQSVGAGMLAFPKWHQTLLKLSSSFLPAVDSEPRCVPPAESGRRHLG